MNEELIGEETTNPSDSQIERRINKEFLAPDLLPLNAKLLTTTDNVNWSPSPNHK